jgi:hypothetical protein
MHARRKHFSAALFDPDKTVTHARTFGGYAMPVGNVKWFNPTKGYGFIQPTAEI